MEATLPRRGLTTGQVVLAAAELADAEGLAAVSLSEVARRSGVRTASLYSHVAGLDDLLARLAALALTEIADRAAADLAGVAGRQALGALCDAYRDYGLAHPGRYAATRHPLDPAGPAGAAARRHAELTRAVLRGYGLGEEGQVHAVRLVGSVVHGFVTLELAGAFAHSQPPSAASWREAVEVLDDALRRLTDRDPETPRSTP